MTLGAGGRRFESYRPDHSFQSLENQSLESHPSCALHNNDLRPFQHLERLKIDGFAMNSDTITTGTNAFSAVNPSLLRALTARNYTEPTPVQRAVLRPDAANRDLLVSAQTGSGKTVAY